MHYFRTLASEKTKRYFFEAIAANHTFRPIWGFVILAFFAVLLWRPILGWILDLAVILLCLFAIFLLIRKEGRKSSYRKDIAESNKQPQIKETRVSDPPQLRR